MIRAFIAPRLTNCEPMRVLLIEDNHDLAANIGEFLEGEGHSVDYAADGPSGLRLATTASHDAIVLDLGLPGLDGVELCRRLRQQRRSAVPILMLTARDTERDTLLGLDAGADDYLTKPCSLAVLEARLRSLQRRSRGTVTGKLRVADLELDLHTHSCRRAGRELELPRSSVRLLELLMSASPGVVSRADVEYALWGDDPPDNTGALRTQIHALRQVIDRGHELKLLHTVHGVGYRIAAADAP